jgi:hypothetical protein
MTMKKELKSQSGFLKRSGLSLLLFMYFCITAFSQSVGINAGGPTPPNPAAGLDINFTTRGLLIPRIALSSINNPSPLVAHQAGLIVYNTSQTGEVIPGFYYNDGSKWNAGLPKPVTQGDMSYWDGTSWKNITVGQPGQLLKLNTNGIPEWSGAGYASSVTTAVTAITSTSASSGGTVNTDGGTPVTARGVCWGTSPGPTVSGAKSVDGAGTGSFTSSITGLISGTFYYVRSYTTNSTGTSYGNQLTFRTQ